MISNLIFDFDGIIIDTESTEFITWREIFQEYGCELKKEVWVDCIGRPLGYFDPFAYLEELSHQKVDREALSNKRRARAKELNAAIPILPGVENLIAQARDRDFKTGVVSSSTRSWVEGHLDRLGLLSNFNAVVCAENTAKHKPDPDPYLEVLNQLNSGAAQAIALEDSPPGIHSAKAAGIFCVAIPSPMTRHMAFDKADLHLETLAGVSLESLLNRISG
jgi:HAD superfamily hydrolase (TIGR01509 family)